MRLIDADKLEVEVVKMITYATMCGYGNAMLEGIDSCYHLVRSVAPVFEWRRVVDFPPNEDKPVLCYGKDGVCISRVGARKHGRKIVEYFCRDSDNSITYWMPMPEFPEEAEA